MKLDYRRLGRYVLAANIILTGLVVYAVLDFGTGEAAIRRDPKLFEPARPVRKAEPERKGIFHDYSIITVDRFLARPDVVSGEAAPLLPIPGPSSALDRLVKLRGTAVSSEKGMSCAIFELLQDGSNVTVRAGEEIAGATVVDIGENSVLVSMENEEIMIFLDATEEYGAGARKALKQNGRVRGNPPGQARAAGGGTPGLERIPPALQERLKNLPPEVRRKWEQASPEDKRKYIKRFLETQKQGARGGDTRATPAARRRR